jgi:hypothetical protein
VRGCLEDFTFHGRDWREGDVLVYALDNLQALLARREAPGLLDKAKWVLEMVQSEELMAALLGTYHAFVDSLCTMDSLRQGDSVPLALLCPILLPCNLSIQLLPSCNADTGCMW